MDFSTVKKIVSATLGEIKKITNSAGQVLWQNEASIPVIDDNGTLDFSTSSTIDSDGVVTLSTTPTVDENGVLEL